MSETKTKPVTVKVTRKWIKKGAKQVCGRCPVALAIRELGYRYVRVSHYACEVGRSWQKAVTVALPRKITNFINNFDGGKPVKPITFRLKLPA